MKKTILILLSSLLLCSCTMKTEISYEDPHKETLQKYDFNFNDSEIIEIWELNDHWIADNIWFFDTFWTYFDYKNKLESMFSCANIWEDYLKKDIKICIRYKILFDDFNFLFYTNSTNDIKDTIKTEIFDWDFIIKSSQFSYKFSRYSFNNFNLENILAWMNFCIKDENNSLNNYEINQLLLYWIPRFWKNINKSITNWDTKVFVLNEKQGTNCLNNINWLLFYTEWESYFYIFSDYGSKYWVFQYDWLYSSPIIIDRN